MQLKWGINTMYVFACKQISMLIEGMSEDSVFMVNVEQYTLHSRWIKYSQKHVYILWFFMFVQTTNVNNYIIFVPHVPIYWSERINKVLS